MIIIKSMIGVDPPTPLILGKFIKNLFFSQFKWLNWFYLHSNHFIFLSPGDDEHFDVIIRKIG